MTKVLIIEDNKDIRENVVEILSLANYQVFEADNGRTGAELAMKHLPDIILCDIMMGDLDGYGVLHLLNKNPQTSAIPFIFITAKSERSDIRKGMELGADDYLTKPFDDTELLSAIETRLRKKEVQKSFYSKALDSINEMVSGRSGVQELQEALEDRKVRTYKKGQIVYYEGDRANGVWIVLKGKVKTTKLAEDGRELLTGVHDGDSFLAINTLFSFGNYADTATAVEESSLVLMPLDQLERMITMYPDVAEKFVKILTSQIRSQEEHLLQLAYQSVRKRVAEGILRMARQSGSDTISVSRIDLASMSGIAPESVSRTLTDLKEEGIIEKKGSTIVILDMRKLEKVKN